MPKTKATKENLVKAGVASAIFFAATTTILVLGIGGVLETSIVFSGAMSVVVFLSVLISIAIKR